MKISQLKEEWDEERVGEGERVRGEMQGVIKDKQTADLDVERLTNKVGGRILCTHRNGGGGGGGGGEFLEGGFPIFLLEKVVNIFLGQLISELSQSIKNILFWPNFLRRWQKLAKTGQKRRFRCFLKILSKNHIFWRVSPSKLLGGLLNLYYLSYSYSYNS